MSLSYLKAAFPKPTKKFFETVEKEITEFVEKKHTTDLSFDALTNLVDLFDEWKLSKKGCKISIPKFYKMRKALAKFRENRRLDYVTSPESETYWAS